MSEFKEIEYPNHSKTEAGKYRLTIDLLNDWDLETVLQVVEGELGGAVVKIEMEEAI